MLSCCARKETIAENIYIQNPNILTTIAAAKWIMKLVNQMLTDSRQADCASEGRFLTSADDKLMQVSEEVIRYEDNS